MRKLKEGKKYKIVGINRKSVWYDDQKDLLGQTVKVIKSSSILFNTLGRFEAAGELEIITGPFAGSEIYIWGFSARAIKDYKVCTCNAYKFPHREGSGKCIGGKAPYCGCCGEPCGWKPQQVGVGFIHRPVSLCCGCDVYMNVQITKLASIENGEDLV